MSMPICDSVGAFAHLDIAQPISLLHVRCPSARVRAITSSRSTASPHTKLELPRTLLSCAAVGTCVVISKKQRRRRSLAPGASARNTTATTRWATAPAERIGDFHPDDPALSDPTLYGQGLYSHADWCGVFRNAIPVDTWTDCEVEGNLPTDLHGILYRNGPGRFERGGSVFTHFLDGDGFVSAWKLEKGLARYRGDFVRTPEYEEEEAAGQILYRGSMGTPKPGGLLANALDLRLKNVANTNVLFWGDKLLTLYEASLPCRLCAQELSFEGTDELRGLLRTGLPATSGNQTIDGLLGLGGDAFTAHPKMDPLRRTLVGFSWTTLPEKAMELTVREWDEDFNLVTNDPPKISLPGCDAQPHDFGLTDRWCVFLENSIKMSDISQYIFGFKGAAQCLESLPHLPQRIHLVPRSKQGPSISIEGPSSAFDVHVAHCHDGPPIGWQRLECQANTDDLVTVYTAGWDELPPGSFLGSWGSEDDEWPFELPPNAPAADFNYVTRTRLLRHVLDSQTGQLVERMVVPGCEDIAMEHPTINCSYTANPKCRYVYMVVGNECGSATPPCGWARADLKTGVVQRWYAGSRAVTEEPHFVPRKHPHATWTPGAPQGEEDEGWLLGVMFDAPSDRSCLCILDAQHIEDGPVCRIWLPHAIPHGLHGCFVPAD